MISGFSIVCETSEFLNCSILVNNPYNNSNASTNNHNNNNNDDDNQQQRRTVDDRRGKPCWFAGRARGICAYFRAIPSSQFSQTNSYNISVKWCVKCHVQMSEMVLLIQLTIRHTCRTIVCCCCAVAATVTFKVRISLLGFAGALALRVY